MKMSKFEKKFVNSRKHAQGNIKKIEQLFQNIDTSNIHNVLEVGCGAGMLARYLFEKHQMKVTGTDVDPEQIEVAKRFHKENKRLNFFTADATDLPFKDSEFDLVLSFMVMHHISNWKRAFEEINRVLKPEGIFIIKDLSYSQLTSKLLGFWSNNYGIYTFDDLTLLLKEKNFSLVVLETPGGILFKKFSLVLQK
jgi:ubiquinone/menaquinone biosynthesis C-methylase UbiE